MKFNRSTKGAILVAVALIFSSCGGDDPEGAPPPDTGRAGSVPEAADEIPPPSEIDDSVFIEIPELKKVTAEEAEAIFTRADEMLSVESFLEAASSTVSEPAKALIKRWEKEPASIQASHFGQTRYIIVFFGPSTGDAKLDNDIRKEFRTAFADQAMKVITEIRMHANAEAEAKAEAEAETKEGQNSPSS